MGAGQVSVGTPLFRVRLKDCEASAPEPLWATIVKGKFPTVLEASGVPEMVAVPLPLSVKVRPAGRAPESEMEGSGEPVVVMVNEEATPTTKVAVAALVMAGGAPVERLAEAVLPVPPLADVTAPVTLVIEPAAVAVTFKVSVQLEDAAIVALASETLAEAATAVAVPPQELARALGVATTRPEGNASVKATPVKACELADGLVSVNVSEVVPFGAMLEAPNDLAMEGGASTARFAEAVPPVPPSVEVTAPVVLLFVPADVPVTLTEKLQDALKASDAPDSVTTLFPAVAVIVPPSQEPMRPLGVAMTRPAGNESVKEMPVSVVDVFGFDAVKVSEVLPLSGMLAAPKDLDSVGGERTVIEAFEVLPVPAVVEVTATLLFFVPEVAPVTFTLKVHDELAASVAPERLTEDEPAVAVIVPPPHDPIRAFGVATSRPAGSESAKATPVSEMLLATGLVIEKLSDVVPFSGIVAAPNVFVIFGGEATARFAEAVLPAPPFVELTFPVTLV